MPIEFKGGLIPYRYNPKTLMLGTYTDDVFLEHDKVFNGAEAFEATGQDWGMKGNDVCGDCVWAAIANYLTAFYAAIGKPIVFTTAQVVAAYSACTGYDPAQTDDQGNNPTDNGTSFDDALTFMINTGMEGTLPDGTTKIIKIGVHAMIDVKNFNHLNAATQWFNGILCAISVDQFMMDEFNAGKAWTIPTLKALRQVLGGHGVPRLKFDQANKATFITWNADEDMSNNCWWGVGLEAWAVIPAEVLSGEIPAPNGLKVSQLLDDLKLVQTA